jgi:xanthine dehydrogenase molybdopterin-binding subunit B
MAPCCGPNIRELGEEDRHLRRAGLPGVEVVLTAKDVPGERLLGHIVHDWPVMIAEGEETRYVGDALVVLAATTKETARRLWS